MTFTYTFTGSTSTLSLTGLFKRPLQYAQSLFGHSHNLYWHSQGLGWAFTATSGTYSACASLWRHQLTLSELTQAFSRALEEPEGLFWHSLGFYKHSHSFYEDSHGLDGPLTASASTIARPPRTLMVSTTHSQPLGSFTISNGTVTAFISRLLSLYWHFRCLCHTLMAYKYFHSRPLQYSI